MSVWTGISRALDNPIIAKDGISRMRSWRAPLAITLYLGLLGGFGYAVFALTLIVTPTSIAAVVGSTVFMALAFFQLALLTLFAPAMGAGAISGERERQTLDVLLVSGITPFGIIWGKLVASLAYLVLLILTSLPLFAAVFLFGGVDVIQFALTILITLMTGITIGSVSIFLSAVFKRTLSATVTAYAAAFTFVVGTGILGTLLSAFATFGGPGGTGASAFDVHPLLLANPFWSLNTVLQQPSGAALPLGRLLQLLVLNQGRPADWGPLIEPWHLTLLSEALVTVLAIVGAVLQLRGRRARPVRIKQPPLEPAQTEVMAS
jgi:ABC-type transport system involved in multi-copper enzyme maturation permease subunit